MDEAPAGYVKMTAGDIRKGAALYCEFIKAERKKWKENLRARLEAVYETASWWARFRLTLTGGPMFNRKAQLHYMMSHIDHLAWNWEVLRILNIPHRPEFSDLRDWVSHVEDMADDLEIIVNIEDAAALKSWLRP